MSPLHSGPSEVMGTGRDMVPKEKALSRCFFTRIQGNWVIGPEPHASDRWHCCVHSRLPQTNTSLSPRWGKLKFPTVVNKTSFIPEALLRQTASIPDMTEVPCLMYPRYWMKFCFEITTRRGVRSVSAGPVRSWSFFFPLSMLNTWPFLQRGPRFSAHWDVVLFAKWCKWLSPHHACKMPFSDALSGNTTDDWWGNTVAGAFIPHESLC